jgi:uncharacterized protein (DUF1330 family)
MPAYLIVDVHVHDADAYQPYIALVPPLVAKHGGEYLVRGGLHETLEGNWQPDRLVVLRFPTVEAARAFVDDPEYAPVKAIRHASATTQLVLVEGL